MSPRRKPDRTSRAGFSAGLSRAGFALGEFRERVKRRLAVWAKDGFLRRLWAKDPALWPAGPASEIRNRLGWLELPDKMRPRLAGMTAFAEEIKAEGFSHAVLLGMGGSSLAPEVFQEVLGNSPGFPRLFVLDSTHPSAVAGVERQIDLARTIFLVSSKSGTTVEPLSFFRYFWARAGRVTAAPGRHFIAVTDPGTPLVTLASERGFRRVFLADPEVGGRFSALTEFGLVPAALIGQDIATLLEGAAAEARANAAGVGKDTPPGLLLGAALGEIAPVRDKLTILTSPRLRSFPDWLEQLIAESTGKEGKGIVPVAGEPVLEPGSYGRDRLFVFLSLAGDPADEIEPLLDSLERAGHPVLRIRIRDLSMLGGEIFRWEVAVAAVGAAIGINPFDQPDVELAKELARQAMASGARQRPTVTGSIEAVPVDERDALRTALASWLGQARPRDYISLQAYLAPDEETSRALRRLRLALLKRTGMATTFGYGPRFLHSTGQLHKGGPDEALVLQLVDEPGRDLAVPETDFTFGALIRAQALGDAQALRRSGRRVVRVNLKGDPAGGIGLIETCARS